MQRTCSACGITSDTSADRCPACHERYVTAADVERHSKRALHPYLVSSFVVAALATIAGGIWGLAAIGFAFAAKRHDRRWWWGAAAGVAAIIVGTLLALAIRSAIELERGW